MIRPPKPKNGRLKIFRPKLAKRQSVQRILITFLGTTSNQLPHHVNHKRSLEEVEK